MPKPDNSNRTYLECPCCGCEGAESDADGLFNDGQELICGCPGWVTADGDGDESWAWINTGDEPCQQCEGECQTNSGTNS